MAEGKPRARCPKCGGVAGSLSDRQGPKGRYAPYVDPNGNAWHRCNEHGAFAAPAVEA